MSQRPASTTAPYRVREVRNVAPSGGTAWLRDSPGGGHVLRWEVMRWARQRGIRYFDMVGLPKPEDRIEADLY